MRVRVWWSSAMTRIRFWWGWELEWEWLLIMARVWMLQISSMPRLYERCASDASVEPRHRAWNRPVALHGQRYVSRRAACALSVRSPSRQVDALRVFAHH